MGRFIKKKKWTSSATCGISSSSGTLNLQSAVLVCARKSDKAHYTAAFLRFMKMKTPTPTQRPTPTNTPITIPTIAPVEQPHGCTHMGHVCAAMWSVNWCYHGDCDQCAHDSKPNMGSAQQEESGVHDGAHIGERATSLFFRQLHARVRILAPFVLPTILLRLLLSQLHGFVK